VDGGAGDGEGGFADGFADGGVGVDGCDELVDGGFEPEGEGGFGDEVGGAGAEDVDAEDFAVFGAGKDFYLAGAAAFDEGFAVAGQGEDACFVGEALGFGRLFGEADAGDFGAGVDAGGDGVAW
jgi:hypothetical protein